VPLTSNRHHLSTVHCLENKTLEDYQRQLAAAGIRVDNRPTCCK